MAKKTPTPRLSITQFRYIPALLLAGTAATFAVSGLPAMFPGSPIGAVALGIAIEVGTLFAFHTLPRLQGWHRLAVLAVALAAAGLNALGTYGYLTRAHVEHAARQSVTAEITTTESMVAEIDRRLAPTSSTTEIVKHGKRTTVTTPNKVDPKLTERLESERTEHLATLTQLRKRQEMNEAEIGPARYLADLIGKTADQTMELVIAAFVLVLQPFAVLLLWAARPPVETPAVKPAKTVRKTTTTKRVRVGKGRALGSSPLRSANDNVVVPFTKPAA
jgi:hypothetical protein